MSTLAGSGTAGVADGLGAAAKFYDPRGVCVDSNGAVYVTDVFAMQIRKVTSAGACCDGAFVVGNFRIYNMSLELAVISIS